LEAGLEIFASPPGKNLQSMSLLSGGEQAMTALALIFAAFLIRPAPVCVLDEVDAALDDANIDRLTRLVEELAGEQTRFLVITHRSLTMSKCDRLYGVTMAEKGVSKLMTLDMEQAVAYVQARQGEA
jgi:chromosome segregation protein